MTQIEVLFDGVPKLGTLTGRQMANDPQTGEHVERLTVQWEDRSLDYVWPHRQQVREVGSAPPPPVVAGVDPTALAHLQPPPGQGPLPPPMPPEPMSAQSSAPQGSLQPGDPGYRPPRAQPSVVVGGQPIIPQPQSFIPPPYAPAMPVVATPVGPPPRRRFMVQSKGNSKPRTFHTHSDCSRVTNGAEQLDLDDAAIEFFNLTQCASCKRQDEQLTWQELAAAFLEDQGVEDAQAAAYRLQAVFAEHGFKVTPPAVDRPNQQA